MLAMALNWSSLLLQFQRAVISRVMFKSSFGVNNSSLLPFTFDTFGCCCCRCLLNVRVDGCWLFCVCVVFIGVEYDVVEFVCWSCDCVFQQFWRGEGRSGKSRALFISMLPPRRVFCAFAFCDNVCRMFMNSSRLGHWYELAGWFPLQFVHLINAYKFLLHMNLSEYILFDDDHHRIDCKLRLCNNFDRRVQTFGIGHIE